MAYLWPIAFDKELRHTSARDIRPCLLWHLYVSYIREDDDRGAIWTESATKRVILGLHELIAGNLTAFINVGHHQSLCCVSPPAGSQQSNGSHEGSI